MPSRLLYVTMWWLSDALDTLKQSRAQHVSDDDRGDVPGWVMITVMTAIVVVALLAVFRTEVINAVQSAFKQVNSSGGSN